MLGWLADQRFVDQTPAVRATPGRGRAGRSTVRSSGTGATRTSARRCACARSSFAPAAPMRCSTSPGAPGRWSRDVASLGAASRDGRLRLTLEAWLTHGADGPPLVLLRRDDRYRLDPSLTDGIARRARRRDRPSRLVPGESLGPRGGGLRRVEDPDEGRHALRRDGSGRRWLGGRAPRRSRSRSPWIRRRPQPAGRSSVVAGASTCGSRGWASIDGSPSGTTGLPGVETWLRPGAVRGSGALDPAGRRADGPRRSTSTTRRTCPCRAAPGDRRSPSPGARGGGCRAGSGRGYDAERTDGGSKPFVAGLGFDRRFRALTRSGQKSAARSASGSTAPTRSRISAGTA